MSRRFRATAAFADLIVDGDSAQGTASGEPMVFTRVDGLWYLEPDSL